MRVFLDANIIFSAAWSGSNPAQYLLQLAALEQHKLVSSAFALEEARRNLALKRSEAMPAFERVRAAIMPVREPTPREAQWAADAGLPEKDAPILASAVAAQANVLVTGDRTHFGHLFGKTIQGTQVLTLADALATLVRNI